MLQVIITVIHILACLFLVLVVLLQTGKGAEMGAVFGGSSSTVFGSSGAGNFLTRLTTAIAVIFMLTSLSLTYLGAHRKTETIFNSGAVEAPPVSQPAEPGGEAMPGNPPPPAPLAQPEEEAPQQAPAAGEQSRQEAAPAPAGNSTRSEQAAK